MHIIYVAKVLLCDFVNEPTFGPSDGLDLINSPEDMDANQQEYLNRIYSFTLLRFLSSVSMLVLLEHLSYPQNTLDSNLCNFILGK